MSKMNYFARLVFFKYSAEIIVFASAFIYSFIAANFLGPEKYGLISYLLIFMASLPGIFGFGVVYDTVKVYGAKGISKNLFKRIFFLSSAFLVMLAVFVAVFPELIVGLLGKGTPEVVSISAVVIFFVPLTLVFQALFSGLKRFGKLLKLVAVEKFLDIIFLVFFLFVLKQGMLSLVFAKIAVALILFAFYFVLYKKISMQKRGFKVAEIKKFFKESALANFMNGVSKQIDIIVFLAFLQPILLGLMYLLQRFETYFYETPANAISEVALPFLSEKSSKKKKIEGYSNLILKFQFVLNVLASVVFVLLLPVIVVFLFPEYTGLIVAVPFVAAGFIFYFSWAFSRIAKSINKNKLITRSLFLRIAIVAFSGPVLIPAYGLVGAAIMLSLSRVIVSVYFLVAFAREGYKLSIIPNPSDLKLFYKVGKGFISSAIHIKK